MAMPPSATGICTTELPVLPANANSEAFIGTSVAPKSTVLLVNCLMPPPEPMPW